MTSAETAMSSHPVLVIETMCKILKTIEQFLHVGNKEKEDLYFRNTQGKGMSHDQLRTAVARSALEAIDVSKAKAIIVFSETGEMAKTLSKGRPNCIIISFTEKKCEVKVNDLRLHYGIYPHEVEYGSDQYIDSTVAEAERVILDRGLLELGDNVSDNREIAIESF